MEIGISLQRLLWLEHNAVVMGIYNVIDNQILFFFYFFGIKKKIQPDSGFC